MIKIELFHIDYPSLELRSIYNFYHDQYKCLATDVFYDAVCEVESLLNAELEKSIAFNVCCAKFLSKLKNIKNPEFLRDNSSIILEIQKLSEQKKIQSSSGLIDFLKLIELFCVPGIGRIDANYQCSVSQYVLKEINYPDDQLPNEFRCEKIKQIMSASCRMNVRTVEHAASMNFFSTSGKQEDPFTREEVFEITFDQEQVAKIELFLKKSQLVHYLFLDQTKYNVYKEQLKDSSLSYDDFKSSVLIDGIVHHDPSCFFSGIKNKLVDAMPPKKIMDLFRMYKMRLVKPSKTDFDNLFYAVIARSDKDSARTILASPYVDASRVDTSCLSQMLVPTSTPSYK